MNDLPKFAGLAIRSRTGDDSRFYNPERDLSVAVGRIMTALSANFNGDKWPYILDNLAPENATQSEKDLLWNSACDANDIVMQILTRATDGESTWDEFSDMLVDCGWDALPDKAKVAYMSILGHTAFPFFVSAIMSESFLGGSEESVLEGYLRIANGARLSFMHISREEDSAELFREVLGRARADGVSWEAIKRIVKREENLEA